MKTEQNSILYNIPGNKADLSSPRKDNKDTGLS